jgi:hypothetical protein
MLSPQQRAVVAAATPPMGMPRPRTSPRGPHSPKMHPTPADAHQDRQTIDDENLASHNDPLGSWTGVPDQADEMPTQDQDDL